MILSEQRATFVCQVLINNYKVNTTHISIKGIGQLSPIATNANEDGKKLNRRVEMVIQ